ncbi:class I SAM-dependent methyltransferase [Thalassococcus lentus]|uniref:SAM-dependent methyltransferase n=1 Tax=Thalassococcus lentus TaxID=1210524 RepID=A0ABT4XPN3_9RHOB|nr:SAM-dependent methyltransferase [Thalassococcus lentus]MDA7423911.1 SAM-dependent methyltransferase [Thalassococcus lentus]
MTPLHDILIRQISRTGPMTIAEYMSACLLHPEHGYYTTSDPIGQSGDFTTAPEISQMFGEMIGLALAQCWLDQDRPAPFVLAELGPGHGTLMADILRVTAAVPGFHDALHLYLLEASGTLRAVQEKTLSAQKPTWVSDLQDLPDLPMFLVANEFLDALPIRQFQRDDHGWRERVIGVKDGALTLGLTDAAPHAALDHRLEDTATGQIVETCAPAQNIAAAIGQHIAAQGGVAFMIDYGDWRSIGDTFQALYQHQPTDPFKEPGKADLTAHVDFEAIAKAAEPAAHSAMTTQGVFLERLGITARAQALAKNLAGTALESHIAAHRRLTHPQEMGSLFKTLALFPKDSPLPPGVDP